MNTPTLPVLTGTAVTLRPITDADTDLIVKWRNTPSVVQNFIFRQTFTPEMHRSWLATKVATGQVVQYIILDNADGKPVGSVYYRDIDNHNCSAEYGIFIGEESARGKGLGTETARLFTDFGFAGLHLHRISLRVLAENAAARRSYEKAGFVQEGVFRDMELLDGAYRALGAVVFLAGFYFLCYRTPLNEVWLPTTMNNDEALYNRQVVSVLTHGGPQGYFGYQESTADIGRYGTWGPLLIWAYALPGLLFGASVNVVLWCNLLLIAVGIAVFARCARLNYWQCIALCGALFSIMLPLRSCVSGASEAMHYMLALLIVGTAAALHRSGKTGWLIACAAACAVETIFRPYALLFWVFPLTAVWQNKRRRAACLGTAAGGFAVSLFAMAKLAAPYFSDGGMDFDGIRLLLQLHPVAAVRYECARAAALLHAAWRNDILPTLHGETTYIGGGCVTFLAVVLVAVVCLVWDKHKGRPLVLKGCALFCSAVIALVLLFMYNIDPRHMMLLAILLLGAVVVEDAALAAVWLPVLVVLLLPMNFQRGSLPEKNAEMAAQMQTVEAALTASVQDAGADPWDHTLAYAYDDGVFHGYLYAVPDGMGIEFDKNSYLWDAENPIYSRYVMCGHDTRVAARLLAENWQQVVSTEDLVIYKRP